ncbi:MAG: oxidoreductase [Treponema sp.]|nr:oxidoreductase [Treponema sp.]
MNKVALVTGASSGIGLETTLALLKKGFTVYGAARRLSLMTEIQENGGNILYLDLTDDDSIQSCVKKIAEKEGRIDVLINNSGYGLGGSVENVSIAQAKSQFEVNVFALVRLTQLVLPYMEKSSSSRIINISSMAGRFSSPFLGWYHASKYAVEALTDSLRLELSSLKIKAVLIEPGLIKTHWGTIAANSIKENCKNTVYEKQSLNVADFYEKNYSAENGSASNPSVISKAVIKAVFAKKPKARYV